MTELAFYHLSHATLERALPKLLEKTLAAGKRAVVMAGSAERVEHLNGALWTDDPASWLPHASARDMAAAEGGQDQPVWLTDRDENPNGAQFLFLTDGASSSHVRDYERCFELFDGRDQTNLERARQKWKAYQQDGYTLTYWQQSEGGGWVKKDV